jgi:hypothetical protein
MMERVSRWAMSSITYILSSSNAKSRIPAFRQGQAIQLRAVQAGGVISPGWSKCVQLSMGSNYCAHPSFPYSPVSLPLGRGEAGSYPHPALEAGESRTSSFSSG